MKKILAILPALNYGLSRAYDDAECNEIITRHNKECGREVLAKIFKVDLENVSAVAVDMNSDMDTQIKQLNTLNRLTAEKYDEVVIIGHNISAFHFAMVKCAEINPEIRFNTCDRIGGDIYPHHPSFAKCKPGEVSVAPVMPMQQCGGAFYGPRTEF